MSRLSVLDAQKKWAVFASEGDILTLGLIPCERCHDATTRVRTAASGVTLCVHCLKCVREIRDAPACAWTRPKGFRVTRKRSSEERLLFVDGPLNGDQWRRGSKIGTGKKAQLITWPAAPQVRAAHSLAPEADGYCWYLYDPIDDVYHHACP